MGHVGCRHHPTGRAVVPEHAQVQLQAAGPASGAGAVQLLSARVAAAADPANVAANAAPAAASGVCVATGDLLLAASA
jgi:hypothetical protein